MADNIQFKRIFYWTWKNSLREKYTHKKVEVNCDILDRNENIIFSKKIY